MALQPLLVGEILDDGVRLVRRHFGVFLRIVGPVAIPYSLFSLGVQLLSVPNEFGVFINGGSTFRSRSILLSILGLVLFTIVGGACVHAAGESMVGRTPYASLSLRTGLRRVLPLLAIGILWMIMLGLFAFTVLGWIVPLVGCCVAIPVCVFERLGPLASIRRSWHMSFRRFFPTLAVIFSGGLLVFALGYFAAIFSVVSLSSSLSRRGYVVVSIVNAVLSLVIAMVFVPLIAAWQSVTYTDLRVRQEGLDLVVALQALPPPSALGTNPAAGAAATGSASRPAPWEVATPPSSVTLVPGPESEATPRRPPWERSGDA